MQSTRRKNKVFRKPYTDKRYISQTFFCKLFNDRIHIVNSLLANMKQHFMSLYGKLILRKRSIIKSANDMLKIVSGVITTT